MTYWRSVPHSRGSIPVHLCFLPSDTLLGSESLREGHVKIWVEGGLVPSCPGPGVGNGQTNRGGVFAHPHDHGVALMPMGTLCCCHPPLAPPSNNSRTQVLALRAACSFCLVTLSLSTLYLYRPGLDDWARLRFLKSQHLLLFVLILFGKYTHTTYGRSSLFVDSVFAHLLTC